MTLPSPSEFAKHYYMYNGEQLCKIRDAQIAARLEELKKEYEGAVRASSENEEEARRQDEEVYCVKWNAIGRRYRVVISDLNEVISELRGGK